MNIFSEIRASKLPRCVIRWFMGPPDHERLQDEVPDEVILRHLYDDYRKMLRERMTLIAYIRKMENIYKEAQTELFKMSMSNNPPTRKRIMQNLRWLAYNLTKDHIDAQKFLREMLGETTEETSDNQNNNDNPNQNN